MSSFIIRVHQVLGSEVSSRSRGHPSSADINWMLALMQLLSQSVADQQGPRGASKDALEDLQRVKACAETRSVQPSCVVCMEDFKDGDSCIKLPCSSRHIFHENCIMPWLKTHNTCPTCRHELEPEAPPSPQFSPLSLMMQGGVDSSASPSLSRASQTSSIRLLQAVTGVRNLAQSGALNSRRRSTSAAPMTTAENPTSNGATATLSSVRIHLTRPTSTSMPGGRAARATHGTSRVHANGASMSAVSSAASSSSSVILSSAPPMSSSSTATRENQTGETRRRNDISSFSSSPAPKRARTLRSSSHALSPTANIEVNDASLNRGCTRSGAHYR